MTKDKNILVFSHMMKTAGTSVTKQFINYYGPKCISPEKVENYKNYQTRFLAGELNLQKAIDILET